MDGMNLLASVFAGIFEGEARDARGSFFRDDLQRLNHAGHDFVLDAAVFALSILAHNDEVHVGIARGDTQYGITGALVGRLGNLRLLSDDGLIQRVE